jgi:hypothetical protein
VGSPPQFWYSRGGGEGTDTEKAKREGFERGGGEEVKIKYKDKVKGG